MGNESQTIGYDIGCYEIKNDENGTSFGRSAPKSTTQGVIFALFP